MAYQTGTSGSTTDLVNKLRAFGEALGWVTNRSDSGVWYFRDPAASMFFAIESANGAQAQHGRNNNIVAGRAIYALAASGYEASGGLTSQPGYRFQVDPAEASVPGMELKIPPTASDRYWFFGTLEYLYVVWRQFDGSYIHLQVGTLDKKGMVYGGGNFVQCTGLYWNSPREYTFLWGSNFYNRNGIRLSGFDTYNGMHQEALGLGDGRYTAHPDNMLVVASANAFTGDTILVPNRILVQGSSNRRWYLGESIDFAVVSLAYCDPEQILTYGAEEWQVFPCFKKGNIGTTNPSKTGSGDTGYAFRLRR